MNVKELGDVGSAMTMDLRTISCRLVSNLDNAPRDPDSHSLVIIPIFVVNERQTSL